MARTTPAMLTEKAKSISRATQQNYFIDWAYGKPRLMRYTAEEDGNTSVSDVSPRLPSGELLRWMHAFYTGYQIGRTRGYDIGYTDGHRDF